MNVLYLTYTTINHQLKSLKTTKFHWLKSIVTTMGAFSQNLPIIAKKYKKMKVLHFAHHLLFASLELNDHIKFCDMLDTL